MDSALAQTKKTYVSSCIFEELLPHLWNDPNGYEELNALPNTKGRLASILAGASLASAWDQFKYIPFGEIDEPMVPGASFHIQKVRRADADKEDPEVEAALMELNPVDLAFVGSALTILSSNDANLRGIRPDKKEYKTKYLNYIDSFLSINMPVALVMAIKMLREYYPNEELENLVNQSNGPGELMFCYFKHAGVEDLAELFQTPEDFVEWAKNPTIKKIPSGADRNSMLKKLNRLKNTIASDFHIKVP